MVIKSRNEDNVGARKTGRKKKSEYRKYKDHLNKLKKMDTALATMRTATSPAMEIAKLKAMSATSSKFAKGGIVKPSTENDMVCRSGELVLSEDTLRENGMAFEVRTKTDISDHERDLLSELEDRCLFNCEMLEKVES